MLCCQERDSLKKHAGEMESLLMKRSDASSSAQKMLLEKDQQIAELLEEGSGHVCRHRFVCVRVCV